jgi:phytanoyl-CoA hydroxylase
MTTLMTTTIKDTFEQDGFYLARGLFSGLELEEMQEEFDRIVKQVTAGEETANAGWQGEAAKKLNGEGRTIVHTHQVQDHSSAYTRAFQSPKFLETSAEILGPNIILHHSKLFMKPPKAGSGFPIHQDWGYFPTEKDSMIAAVIHLSDATDEMGCFRLVPGSHRLGREQGTMGGGGKMSNPLLDQYPLDEATPLEAKAGDVVFFHYFTLHGSFPNDSDQSRKTVLVQMHSGDDVLENPDQHPYARVALKGHNTRLLRVGSGPSYNKG